MQLDPAQTGPGGALPSPLLAIADAGYLGGQLVEKICSAQRGGVKWVLLRAKELSPPEREALAVKVLERCPGLALSVHSGPQVEGIWGVHRASERLAEASNSETSSITVAETLPVGYSCHSSEELRLAKLAGAAYCLLSPVFAPTSKQSHLPPLGWDGFQTLSLGENMPLYALGGMTPERAKVAADAGAAGVAVSGDLFGGNDVEASAAQWRLAVDSIFN